MGCGCATMSRNDPPHLVAILDLLRRGAAPDLNRVLPGDGDGPSRMLARVSDSGPGIAPEAAEQIWRPFYTTKKGGTGLGLPISKRIVNAHNGTIAVQSFPGSGTIFTVSLPAGECGRRSRAGGGPATRTRQLMASTATPGHVRL